MTRITIKHKYSNAKRAIYFLILIYLVFPNFGLDLSPVGINTKFPFAKFVTIISIFSFLFASSKSKKLVHNFLIYPLFGFVLAEFIFSLISHNTAFSLLSSINDFVLIYLFASLLLRVEFEENEVFSFYRFARHILTIVCILLVVESLLNKNIYLELVPSSFYGGDKYAWAGMQQRLGRIRAVGPYGQAIGASVWAGVCLGLYIFIPTRRFVYRMLGIGVSSAALLATFSRGGILGTLIILIALGLLFLLKKTKVKYKIISFSGIVLIFIASFVSTDVRLLTWGSMSKNYLPTSFKENEGYTLETVNFSDRILSSMEIAEYYSHDPIRVLGAGTLRYGGKGQIFRDLPRSRYITNLYSILLIEVGLPAVFFFILFLYRLLKLNYSNFKSTINKKYNMWTISLYILGIYILNTLSLQVMLDPIYLLLVLLPITVKYDNFKRKMAN